KGISHRLWTDRRPVSFEDLENHRCLERNRTLVALGHEADHKAFLAVVMVGREFVAGVIGGGRTITRNRVSASPGSAKTVALDKIEIGNVSGLFLGLETNGDVTALAKHL